MQAYLQPYLNDIRSLMRRYDVSDAYVFGSAAKGTMHSDSDVDFLVSFAPGLDYERYDDNYFGLLYGLQELLHKNVDIVASETVKNPYFLQSINETKVSLF